MIDVSTIVAAFMSYVALTRMLVVKLYALKSPHAYQVGLLVKFAVLAVGTFLIFNQLTGQGIRFTGGNGAAFVWSVVLAFLIFLYAIIIRAFWILASDAKRLVHQNDGNDATAKELARDADWLSLTAMSVVLAAGSICIIVLNAIFMSLNSPFGIASRATHQVIICVDAWLNYYCVFLLHGMIGFRRADILASVDRAIFMTGGA